MKQINEATSKKGSLFAARTLLVAPGPTTRNKKLLVTKGIATSSNIIKHHQGPFIVLPKTTKSFLRVAFLAFWGAL